MKLRQLCLRWNTYQAAIRAPLISVGLASLMVLGACSNRPPTPDWQLNAEGSLERFVAAYLKGDPRVEALEFDRARSEIARTGRPDLMARAELLRCASRLASLVIEPCAGFEALRLDAPAAEKAYASYLVGQVSASDVALLPEAQRAAAASPSGADALKGIKDPLSRLVAAGVVFRRGLADPGTIDTAITTASEQGWRRPLLAWLGLQRQRAEQAGAQYEVQRLTRRIQLIVQPPGKP